MGEIVAGVIALLALTAFFVLLLVGLAIIFYQITDEKMA